MKKVILAVFSLLSISAATYAQTAVPAKKAATDSKMKAIAAADKKDPARVVPMQKTTTTKAVAPTPATAPVAKTTAVVKKDGTPDKRFKANKAATTATKKDGTPDMRYKENKAKPKS